MYYFRVLQGTFGELTIFFCTMSFKKLAQDQKSINSWNISWSFELNRCRRFGGVRESTDTQISYYFKCKYVPLKFQEFTIIYIWKIRNVFLHHFFIYWIFYNFFKITRDKTMNTSLCRESWVNTELISPESLSSIHYIEI